MVKPEELDDGSPAEATPARPSRATPARNERSGLTHKPLPSVDMALLPHERRAARSRQVTLVASLALLVFGVATIALAKPWVTAFFKGEPMPSLESVFASPSEGEPIAGAAAPPVLAAGITAAPPVAAQPAVVAAAAPSVPPIEPVTAIAERVPAVMPAVAPLGNEPILSAALPYGTPSRTVKAFGQARGFRDALIRSGVEAADADALIASFEKVVDFRRAQPDDQFIFERDPANKLLAVEYRASATERFRAQRQPDGKFAGSRVQIEVVHRRIAVGGYVADSLGEALEGVGLKSSAAGMFVEAFEGKIDFKKHARQGDSFRLILEEDFVEGQSLGYQRIYALQYAGAKAGDAVAFWFETSPGEGDFYDENGRGLHGGWLRTPLRYDHLSSPFDLRRRHPILKRIMPHTGVDYAAAPGTTVWAAADGVVTFAGKRGPNGNLVGLQHPGGYETYYAHLLRISQGITRGAKVKQRQPIGAVGSTGRSTGPHLHFALKRGGRFIDPSKLVNGPGKLLPEALLAKFKHQVAQLKRELGGITLAAAPAPIGAPASAKDDFHDEAVDL